MNNSQIQRANSGVTEIVGRPGQVWGNVVVPAGGKASMRIDGDILRGTVALNLGLETKEIYTRIQKIDSVEVVEGRIWWLLILGIATIIWLVGIVPIILFFVIKQQWIVVHSGSACLVLFHKNTNQAKQFSQTLLTMARQLNAPASVPRVNPTTNPSVNHQRPAPAAG
ncbi:MAG: hypothetical protein SFW36_04495 [Leptolyngbyaceae cyanobacterium bins.59]|nr:hypothetical protein [Leptolyngbyaceae cyanobacterium bins.59]